mmetsp:Transcript_45364/g.95185  ORF Transcript_45364/g.95185 Transcript_45364/m.95185 type:complete len:212 (+) Transcript_45364:243-878(+)
MIASPRYGHDARGFDLVRMIVYESRKSLYFTHCSDGNLRRKNHRRHIRSANCANVAQCEGRLSYISFGKIALGSQRIQPTQLHSNLQHTLLFTPPNHRHGQSSLGIDRHTHIMSRMVCQLHFLHINRRIQHGILCQSQRGCLDEEGHISQSRHTHILCDGTECIAHLCQSIDVDFIGVDHVGYLKGGCHGFDHEAIVSSDGDDSISFSWLN